MITFYASIIIRREIICTRNAVDYQRINGNGTRVGENNLGMSTTTDKETGIVIFIIVWYERIGMLNYLQNFYDALQIYRNYNNDLYNNFQCDINRDQTVEKQFLLHPDVKQPVGRKWPARILYI